MFSTPWRNSTAYPTNAQQNKLEVEEAREFCESVCNCPTLFSRFFFVLIHTYIHTYGKVGLSLQTHT